MDSDSTIMTERLQLRPPTLDDAEQMFSQYSTDPIVSKYLTWKPHGDISETIGFLEDQLIQIAKGDFKSWCIIRRTDNTLMGMIDLRVSGFSANSGYVLGNDYWGNGYMTEALSAVREVVMDMPHVYRYWLICDVDNPASAKVMEKSGFQFEGILRRFCIHPNISASPRDSKCYSVVKQGS